MMVAPADWVRLRAPDWPQAAPAIPRLSIQRSPHCHSPLAGAQSGIRQQQPQSALAIVIAMYRRRPATGCQCAGKHRRPAGNRCIVVERNRQRLRRDIVGLQIRLIVLSRRRGRCGGDIGSTGRSGGQCQTGQQTQCGDRKKQVVSSGARRRYRLRIPGPCAMPRPGQCGRVYNMGGSTLGKDRTPFLNVAYWHPYMTPSLHVFWPALSDNRRCRRQTTGE